MLDFRKRTAAGMQRSGAVMPPALLGQADRLHDSTGRSMELSTSNPNGTARTLLHGDCHSGQTYRTATGARDCATGRVCCRGAGPSTSPT
jgi:hypothetical protein